MKELLTAILLVTIYSCLVQNETHSDSIPIGIVEDDFVDVSALVGVVTNKLLT